MSNQLRITKQTNESGFYLLTDGTPSIYKKSSFTQKDIHYLNMEAKEAGK